MPEIWDKVFIEVTNPCFTVGKTELECWVSRKGSLKTDGFSKWLDMKNGARICKYLLPAWMTRGKKNSVTMGE